MVCQRKRKEEGCMRREEKDTIGRYECCYIIFENAIYILRLKEIILDIVYDLRSALKESSENKESRPKILDRLFSI